MKSISKASAACATIVASMLGMFLGMEVAEAVTDAAFRYSSPKRGYLMLPTAAFQARTSGGAYYNGGYYLQPGSAQTGCYSAPINVPHGATLSSVRVWYVRQAGSTNVAQFILERYPVSKPFSAQPIANTHQALAPASTSYAVKAYEVETEFSVVNNAAYGYILIACLGDNAEFYGARVDYTVEHAGE